MSFRNLCFVGCRELGRPFGFGLRFRLGAPDEPPELADIAQNEGLQRELNTPTNTNLRKYKATQTASSESGQDAPADLTYHLPSP